MLDVNAFGFAHQDGQRKRQHWHTLGVMWASPRNDS
jgi:hypothetical protein